MTNKPSFEEAIRIHAKCSTVTFNKKTFLPFTARKDKDKEEEVEEEIFKKDNSKTNKEPHVKKCESGASTNQADLATGDEKSKSVIAMNFESPIESVEIIKACKNGPM